MRQFCLDEGEYKEYEGGHQQKVAVDGCPGANGLAQDARQANAPWGEAGKDGDQVKRQENQVTCDAGRTMTFHRFDRTLDDVLADWNQDFSIEPSETMGHEQVVCREAAGHGVAGRASDGGSAVFGDNVGTGLSGEFTTDVAVGQNLSVGSDVNVSANAIVGGQLRCAGLRPSERGPQYRTVLLDVERPLDALRASLHQHWRRQLKRAEKNDLEVTFGTEPERFEAVAQMLSVR